VYLVTLFYAVFCFCDLDLKLMTLVYDLELGILKMYMRTENEVSRSKFPKVIAQTGTHSHRDAIERRASRICGW